MAEQSATVYNVQINGEQRKAFDAVALKRYLEGKKSYYSMLNLNPDKIDVDEPAIAYVAKAATETLAELELAVDEALGLVEPREDAEVPEDKNEDMPDNNKDVEVKEDPVEESDSEESEEAPKEVDESEEKIVL